MLSIRVSDTEWQLGAAHWFVCVQLSKRDVRTHERAELIICSEAAALLVVHWNRDIEHLLPANEQSRHADMRVGQSHACHPHSA